MANRIFNIENGGLNLCSTTGNSFDTIENNNVLSHYSLKICFSTKNYKNISEMELRTQILADDAKGMSNKAKLFVWSNLCQQAQSIQLLPGGSD
jgi:hypothetical protein